MNRMNTPNTLPSPEELLPQVEKMLHGLAWRFHKAYGVPYDEALSEAYYYFMNSAVRLWKPDKKTKFSTWCHFVVERQMISWIRSRAQGNFIQSVPELPEVAAVVPDVQEQGDIAELLSSLSEDAQEIASLIMDFPRELFRSTASKRVMAVTRKHMTWECGKSVSQFHNAMEELRAGLKGVVAA